VDPDGTVDDQLRVHDLQGVAEPQAGGKDLGRGSRARWGCSCHHGNLRHGLRHGRVLDSSQSLRNYRDYPIWRPSFVIALLMSSVGVLLFFAITFGAL
jgi:hypothetical protein